MSLKQEVPPPAPIDSAIVNFRMKASEIKGGTYQILKGLRQFVDRAQVPALFVVAMDLRAASDGANNGFASSTLPDLIAADVVMDALVRTTGAQRAIEAEANDGLSDQPA